MATKAMNAGDYNTAIAKYQEASECADTLDEHIQAIQMRGVVERLARRFEDSRYHLALARFKATDNRLLRARINRDLAMTSIDEMGLIRHWGLGTVNATLDDALEAFAEDDPEYWITLGYKGRAYLKVGRRAEARRVFQEADEHLQTGDNRNYELNNLVWLLRTLPSQERRSLIDNRAFALVGVTNQTRRIPELKILAVGGNRLYVLLDHLRRSRLYRLLDRHVRK